MPTPSFHAYPGLGQQNSNSYHYSQSVRIGPLIKTSGQVGFNDSGEVVTPIKEQIRTAFHNVEKALKDAGGEGWSQVVSVHTYHRDLDGSFEIVVEMFKDFMPNRRPVWVAVGVAALAEGIDVEMEVEAHVDG